VSLLSGEATYVLTVLWLMVLQQVKLQPDLKWEEARNLMLDWI
jgi:hypothetical protein